MRQEDAAAIVHQFLNADKNLLPCHIESLRFIPAERSSERPHWAAVLAFDVDEDHAAYFSMPIVSVDDETGVATLLKSL